VPQVQESYRPEPAPTPPRPPERTPTSPSGASGKTYYLELKGQNLPPQDLFDRGEQADRTGDCEASIRLLIDAAKRAPGLAERLARRYDPEGFEPTPCFPQAKPDSAMVWYQNAAEQGIPAAQRRYGELLLGEAASGPIYQDAVDWLRKAATAGDAAAAKRLETLGER
jgi:TPR repeat protein